MKGNKKQILVFDCETSPMLAWIFQTGKQRIGHNQIETEFFHMTRIICISYMWSYEKKVHHLHWTKGHSDKTMLKQFCKVAAEADLLVAHNGPKFDVRTIRARIAFNGLEDSLWPETHCIDTLADYRRAFRLPSYRLDAVAQMLGQVGKHSMSMQDWVDVCKNKPGALEKMVKYCDQDVRELNSIFKRLDPYIPKTAQRLNQEAAAFTGLLSDYQCPVCSSNKLIKNGTRSVQGERQQALRCTDCGHVNIYFKFGKS